MIDLTPPDVIYGLLALGGVVLFAAWHEFRSKNPRDARFLAVIGAAGLAGGVATLVV